MRVQDVEALGPQTRGDLEAAAAERREAKLVVAEGSAPVAVDTVAAPEQVLVGEETEAQRPRAHASIGDLTHAQLPHVLAAPADAGAHGAVPEVMLASERRRSVERRDHAHVVP